jgi:hypothetical protein
MKRIHKAFGRRFAPDKRDMKYRLAKPKTERKRRYWRNYWKDANQGEEPACVGYACAGWLDSQPIRQWIDPLWVYRIATYIDEWPEEDWENSEGTSVRAGMTLLANLGFIKEYRWETTVKRLLPHMLEVSPIVLGTNIYTGMCKPDARNFIAPTGKIEGGHAYLWDGVDVVKGVARMKYCWTDAWGDNGHVWMKLDDLDRLLKEEGEACAGIEQKPAA